MSTAALLALSLAAADVQWHASTKTLADRGQDLRLDGGPHRLQMEGGWICEVSAASQHALYEARQVTCRKGEAAVEFSVQCEASRPKDRTQLRFRDAAGNLVDIVEVGCERGAR